jgi:hypothetical protein
MLTKRAKTGLMMMKRKQDPQKSPIGDALAALSAQMSEIRRNLNADEVELKKLDQPGVWRSGESTENSRIARAARELLNGSVAGLLPPAPLGTEDRKQALRLKVKVANKALEEGEKLVVRLQEEAAEERYKLRAHEVKAAMTDIVDAVLALEQAFQRRDALIKEIKPEAHRIPAAGWALLGRIGRSESMAYRFAQMTVTTGWLSEERFNAAVNQSRKAMGS